MNILRGIASLALVFALAACGASGEAPEIVAETAELEIQIVTSLPDSEPIGRLEVVDEDGKVLYVASNFVNRFHVLTLGMGKTFQVIAQANFSDHAQSGTVTLTREVTLVAANQSVVLDLRPAYTSLVLFNTGEDGFAFSIPVYKNIDRDSVASSLTFTIGSYLSHTILPIDVVHAHFGAGTIGWSENLVHMNQEMFGGSAFDFVRVEVRYSDVPRINCRSAAGVFDLSWENEFSQLNQRLEVSVPCKG